MPTFCKKFKWGGICAKDRRYGCSESPCIEHYNYAEENIMSSPDMEPVLRNIKTRPPIKKPKKAIPGRCVPCNTFRIEDIEKMRKKKRGK